MKQVDLRTFKNSNWSISLKVYTAEEISVANGTPGKLACKSQSPDMTSSLTSDPRSFQP
ncbi:PREDICTED: myelin protein zero-like protein 1 [Chrysochloris asiatica]|uniref:Myelin protein zero-like protein 1 n=1 Tax=Chrysochloris asiatica TaxID=185453 RepID=A0A9B0TYM7_CHRAS|nr:PREDICTED: myelin protein zero-like protein 1 [Chrysochloris asiatica]